MLKKSSLLSLIFCLHFFLIGGIENGFSQTGQNGTIIAFHPSLGKTVDQKEKKDFGLFPEYTDSLFESAQLVKYAVDSFTVLFKTKIGKSFERPISIHELDKIYATIEQANPSSTVETKNEEDSKEREIKRRKRNETANNIGEITYLSFEFMLDLIYLISIFN
ncbi:MAG: hypothetical protein NTX97_03070 [Bacteroidetes bacterium]|nr:hypothetical protein [Bacteroidota bacterium]